MDDVSQLFQSDVEIHQRSHFLYDSSGIGTHDMTSDYLGIRLRAIADDFYESFGGLYSLRLAVAAVEAFVGSVVGVLGFCLILGQPDGSHFGTREDRSGHDVETNAVIMAQNMVNYMAALRCCCMSQHLTAIDITNGIDSRHRGGEIVVDKNAVAIILNAGCFEM